MNDATDWQWVTSCNKPSTMGQTVAQRGRNVHRGSNKTGTKSETVGTVFSLKRSSFPRTGDWWWRVHRWGLTGCGPGGGDWLGWLIKRTMGTDRGTVCKYRCNAGDTNSHSYTLVTLQTYNWRYWYAVEPTLYLVYDQIIGNGNLPSRQMDRKVDVSGWNS